MAITANDPRYPSVETVFPGLQDSLKRRQLPAKLKTADKQQAQNTVEQIQQQITDLQQALGIS